MTATNKKLRFKGLHRYVHHDHVDLVMIHNEVLNQLLAEGYAEEYAKVYAIEFTEGFAEGFAEGRADEKIDIARTMKSDGLPIETITKYTGLSAEEIANL